MYILTREDMDDIAMRLLNEYAPNVLKYPQPVGIGMIAEEKMGLTLKYQYLSAQGNISGLLAFDDTEFDCFDSLFRPVKLEIPGGTVLIDSNLSDRKNYPRRRYTISHEVCHWILHRSYHSPQNKQYQFRSQSNVLIACRDSDICRERKSRDLVTDHDWEEWQADALAAAVIMPLTTFREESSRIIHGTTGARFLHQDMRKAIFYDTISNGHAKIKIYQNGIERHEINEPFELQKIC